MLLPCTAKSGIPCTAKGDTLVLAPHSPTPGDNPAEDCLEAACRMVANHAALTRFALRGPGKPGPR
jgi:glutathione S-transferase